MSPTERLVRAFTLSAFVRDVAWAGAQRIAGGRGPVAVRERFLMQLYGSDLSDGLRALTAGRDPPAIGAPVPRVRGEELPSRFGN